MSNRYPGTCYRCGGVVATGAGVFEKIGKAQIKKWGSQFNGRSWQVQHHDCAKQWKGTDQHWQFNDLRNKTV